MLFEDDNNFDFNFLNKTFFNNNTNNNLNVLNAKEGFLRGNMFKNEYKPYKNYTFVAIKPKSDREAKLLNVMQYSFAINDLQLFLDINPDSREAIELLNEYIIEEKKAKDEYLNNYGPLEICDNTEFDYEWVNSPWPWENEGGNMYV